MHTTTSRDGTSIARDHEGDGDPLVLVGGAMLGMTGQRGRASELTRTAQVGDPHA